MYKGAGAGAGAAAAAVVSCLSVCCLACLHELNRV